MGSTALYLITLLMLIMTSSALEESALSEKHSQRVKRDNKIRARDRDQPLSIKTRTFTWIEHTGWYEQGQYMLPNRNGCGGDITAIDDYLYGSLTSPNWPNPLPSQVECTWTMRGFSSLFFVVNGLQSKDRSNEYGRLTVRIQGRSDRQIQIPLGGDYLHHKFLLNVRRRVIWLTLTTKIMGDTKRKINGTKLTWWTVPAPKPAFVKIFNTQLSEGRTINSTDLLSVEKTRTGYIFLFKNDISSYNTFIGMTALLKKTPLPCLRKIWTYTTSHSQKVKLLNGTTCDPASKRLTLAVLGRYRPISTPFGIQFKIPRGVSHLNLSINAELAEDSPAYTVDQGCNALNVFTKNGLGYYGTAKSTSGNKTSMEYIAGLRCDLNVSVPMPIMDSFFQVQTQTDIELSPSCVVDFLQIGGQRVCGVNKPDTYISSPVDNSLIERTGTYYINILQDTTTVFASPSISDIHKATFALNPDPSQCYVSAPGVSSPFWVVDLVDVFIVQGARIVPARLAEKSNVTVVVYINAKAQPWPEQYYQTCWRGPLTSYSGLLSCHRPVSGRYLAILKESVYLSLCKVEVFVNIAAPLVAWRNVAYRKNPSGNFHTNTSYDRIVDGDPYTCLKYEENIYYHIDLGHRNFTVQAVRLYADSDEVRVAFQVKTSEAHCMAFDGPNDKHMGILVSCTIPMVTNHVLFTDLINFIELCEVIIYAEVNDKTNANAALHTEASKSLRSTLLSTSVPEIVDGSLTSCDSADDAFFVDLTGLHVVEGVILNLGDNQHRTVQVEVWISPSTSNAEYLCHGKAYTDSEVLQLLCSLPIVGKHVILKITDNQEEVLHLCELQVIAVPYDKKHGLQNVALFKHVRQGPMSIPPSARVAPHIIYHGQGARLAVDGDRSNNDTNLTCTTVQGDGHTAAWWEVDLANVYRVEKVGLFLCPGANYRYRLRIEVSDGRARSKQVFYKGPPRNHMSPATAGPILGRYVRLSFSNDLCLCEVEVMAAPLTTFERFGERPRHVKDSLFDLFTLVTDGRLEKRGFSTWYKIDNLKDFKSLADCGQLVRDNDTTLLSPNHPHGYILANDSFICHWMVYTPYNSFTLVYIDHLNLTMPVSENMCLDDVLIISNSAGQQITKCGQIKNEIVNMKSYRKSFLHITLVVRKYNPKNNRLPERGGLSLRFLTYPNCINKVIEVHRNNPAVLSSPLYPEKPPPYAWCKWILVAKTVGIMILDLLKWNIEHDFSANETGCDIEVLIRSRHTGMERFCRNNPPYSSLKIPVRLKDLVTITFTTKENVVGSGFQLYYEITPARKHGSSTVDHPKAYSAEVSSRTKPDKPPVIRFDRVILQENFLAWDNRVFIIIEAGLYVVSIRIVPEDIRSPSFMVLKLINKNTTLVAYGNHGQIASVTAAMKLDTDDMLMVSVYPGERDILEHTSIAFVYVSPVEGGFAFAGYQKEVTFNCSEAVDCRPPIMSFSNVFTLVPGSFDSEYKEVITPVSGIYWISLRPGHTIGNLANIHVNLYKGRSPTFLASVAKDHVPGSVSAAAYFQHGEVLKVHLYGGVSGIRSLFSIVLIAKNIRLYTQAADHIAFTGLLGECRWINPNYTTLSFNYITVNHGVMRPNSSSFVVPTNGLYIISIRSDLTDQEGCDGHLPPPEQHLYINVNGRMKVTAVARQNPTEYVTVLRLETSDILTVSARDNDIIGEDTLFSFAFVDV